MTPIIYYVYILFRDDAHLIPFYVGKGNTRTKRMYDHEGKARRGEKSHKASIIRQIQGEGRAVPKERIDCDNEAEAFALEIELIAFFGRKDNGTGILANGTNGGEGASGLIMSDEARAAQRARVLALGDNHPSKRPEARAAMRAHMLALGDNNPNKRPEFRAAMCGDNNPSKRPEVRAAQIALGDNHPSKRPEVRAAIRAGMLALGDNHPTKRPEFNNPMKRPECRAAHSAYMLALGDKHPSKRPEVRAAHSFTMAALYRYPTTAEPDGSFTVNGWNHFDTRKEAKECSRWLYQILIWQPQAITIEQEEQFEFREAAE